MEDFEFPSVPNSLGDDMEMDDGNVDDDVSSPVLKIGEEKEIGKNGLKKKLLQEGEKWDTPENGDEVEDMSYYGRGAPPYRGRGGRTGNILVSHGRRTLINKNISQDNDPLFQEFLEFKKQKEGSSSSYANILAKPQEEDHNLDYIQNEGEKIILILNDNDLRWQDEPYTLLERYTLHHGYTAGSYKSQNYFENLLINCGSCEISHFSGQNKEIYNFSKFIVKKIISPEEWGLSPFKEKSLTYPNGNSQIKYNYWDYLEAFDKVLFYENEKRKHTWMIKICSKVYNYNIPNWFVVWWQFYGANEAILPEKVKEYFDKWSNTSPRNQNLNEQAKRIKSFMMFMIEFSIPYIWKWTPEIRIIDHIPRLIRRAQVKFWDKMVRPDPNTGIIAGTDTFKEIEDKLKEFARLKLSQEMDKKPTAEKFSRQQLIEQYLIKMEKEIIQLDEEDKKSDVSMTGSNQSNTFKVLEDSQDPNEIEEINYTDLFEEFKDNLKRATQLKNQKSDAESSKGKEKMIE